jgi:hypothetical protein
MARILSLGGIPGRTEAPPDGNGAPVDDQADDGANGEARARGHRIAGEIQSVRSGAVSGKARRSAYSISACSTHTETFM